MTVLAPDVTLLTDGGGKAGALRLRPITGGGQGGAVPRGPSPGGPYMGMDSSAMTLESAEINGSPGTLIMAGDRAIAALTLTVSDGRITPRSSCLPTRTSWPRSSAGRTLPRC